MLWLESCWHRATKACLQNVPLARPAGRGDASGPGNVLIGGPVKALGAENLQGGVKYLFAFLAGTVGTIVRQGVLQMLLID